MAKLTFHGAARQVTGSMHIIEANGKSILLDCGLFQGRRQVSRELNLKHPIPPSQIHAVVLSHAHIDHTGRLPLLVRDGFTGVIHATPATRDLSAIMLPDSAHIQEEDARWMNKKRRRNDEPEIEPLYAAIDAVQCVRQYQSSPFGRWFKVAHGIHARYFEAGHMLGSAGVEVELTENDRKTTLVFSGDVGRAGTPILRDPAPLPPCDYLICESTYGGRTTEPVFEMKGRLAEAVRRTVKRGGKIFIPAFSVGRTQTIIYHLRELFVSGELSSLPVYIDSPLATNATDVFRLHPECYDRDAREFAADSGGLLDGPQFHYVRTREDSKRVTRRRNSCIVISASGMCEAGRILHHLTHGAPNPKNTILMVGFQAEHTLGRRIVERQPEISIYGQKVNLAAEVITLNGFSSHADATELLRHVNAVRDRCRGAFLVHGETDQSEALAKSMRDSGHRSVNIPAMGESFELMSP